jgi:RNA polymerase sigma-70 factor (subfamily 1)
MSDDNDIEQSLHDSHLTVLAIKSGDMSVLGRLTHELRPYLRRVIQNELNAVAAQVPDDNSDLIQQTLLKAVQSIDSFRGQSLDEWRVWLAVIARNEVRMSSRYWNSQKRSLRRQADLGGDSLSGMVADDETPSADLRSRELSSQLSKAVASLSEAERQIIAWRQDDGLSHLQIAERLGISVDAARQRCKAAMDNLRKAFLNG